MLHPLFKKYQYTLAVMYWTILKVQFWCGANVIKRHCVELPGKVILLSPNQLLVVLMFVHIKIINFNIRNAYFIVHIKMLIYTKKYSSFSLAQFRFVYWGFKDDNWKHVEWISVLLVHEPLYLYFVLILLIATEVV